jgi:hypothetical protein
MTPRRVVLVIGATVIVVVLVSGAIGAMIWYSVGGSGKTSKRPPATKVTIFATPIGNAPKGSARLDGNCNLGGSDVSNRPDAARCFTTISDASGSNVFDPCFHSEGGSTPGMLDLFVCPGDPWKTNIAGTVVVVRGGAGTLGEAPSSEVPSSFTPWALLLANGQHCLAIGGATGTTAGLRYNYFCGAGGIVLGDPDQHAPTWTVLFAKNTSGSSFTRVSVRAAYD